MGKPDLSIVVLNWNTSELLNGALKSIVETAGDISYEVFVIDNASTDGGLSRVDDAFKHNGRFSFIQNEKNEGWAAINSMLTKATGKYIATVDPDAVVHAHALQALLAFMNTHADAGAVTASLFNPDGSPQLYFRRILTPKIFFFTTVFGRLVDKWFLGLREWKRYRYDDLDVSKVSEVEQPAWPCLVWRHEALGDFIVNPEIPFYFLDVDLSRRVYDRGFHIYVVPEAKVTHLKSTSYSRAKGGWRKKEFYRSLMVYLKTHYANSLWWTLPLLALDRVVRALIFTLTGKEPLR